MIRYRRYHYQYGKWLEDSRGWQWTDFGNGLKIIVIGVLPVKPNLVCSSVCIATKTLSSLPEENDLPMKKIVVKTGVETWTQNFQTPEITSAVIVSHRLDLQELHCVNLGMWMSPVEWIAKVAFIELPGKSQEGLGPDESCFWCNFQFEKECKETGLRSYSHKMNLSDGSTVITWSTMIDWYHRWHSCMMPCMLPKSLRGQAICACLFTQSILLTPRLTPDTGVPTCMFPCLITCAPGFVMRNSVYSPPKNRII